MRSTNVEKISDQVMELAGNLTSEETAQLAGQLLDLAGVNRDTCIAFLLPLGDGDKEELAQEIQSFLEG